MTEYKRLKKLHKNFIQFQKEEFAKDVENKLGVKELSLSTEIYKKVYENFYKPTFVEFVSLVKSLIFKGPQYFLEKNNNIWDLLYYLRFLESERVIKMGKGNLKILDEDVIKDIIPPFSQKKIIEILEEKLKIKLANYSNLPVFKIFFKFEKDFKWKEDYDQLPISTSSAIFLLEKILEYLPLGEKMLFVGDDDFISLLLALTYPKIGITVIDIDERVLEIIEGMNKKFDLPITTQKMDVRKAKIEEKFIAVLTNPPYTEDGVKVFLKFGASNFSEDGGICFLIVGDDAIRKRFLFLQQFFTELNLQLQELIPSVISYPHIKHKEFDIVVKRLSKYLDMKKETILKASIYIFNYIPWKIKPIKYKREIYSYL